MDLEPDPDLAAVEAARRRIAGLIRVTPLLASEGLAARCGTEVYLKLESLQATGSFKLRGAANKILGLAPEERRRGVVTCSSGNHGLAVAHVAGRLGVPATISVPTWIDPVKRSAIERTGATALAEADSYDAAEERARELAASRGLVFIEPFDDPAVIAGQGTVGLEVLDALPGPGTIVVPLSGGGLVIGVALAVKALSPATRVLAAYAERAPVMAESLAAGRPLALPEEETLASALAGGIGLDNRYTLRLVGRLVDGLVAVAEEEIAAAMAFAFGEHRLVVEGGGAVAIAALLAGRVTSPPGPVVAVVSGGNVDLQRLAAVLSTARAAAGAADPVSALPC